MVLTPAVIGMIGNIVAPTAQAVQQHAGVEYDSHGRPKLNRLGEVADAFNKLGGAASMYGGFMEKIGKLDTGLKVSTKGKEGLAGITGSIDDPTSNFGGMVEKVLSKPTGSAPLSGSIFDNDALSNTGLGITDSDIYKITFNSPLKIGPGGL